MRKYIAIYNNTNNANKLHPLYTDNKMILPSLGFGLGPSYLLTLYFLFSLTSSPDFSLWIIRLTRPVM